MDEKRKKALDAAAREKGGTVYIASEEAAIRAMEPGAGNIWAPSGGEPVIVTVKEGTF